MKTTQFLFCVALLFGLTASSTTFAATATTASAKKTTYAVIGYYRGATPAPALVEKALREIGAKMKDFAAVQDSESADRVVAVVFRGSSYQINFAAPTPEAIQYDLDTIDNRARVQAMLTDAVASENRDGHGRGK